MGVPVMWIFNPRLRNVTICLRDGSASKQNSGLLTVPGTPIAVDLAEIYSALDEE
jgi:hypothetical protein